MRDSTIETATAGDKPEPLDPPTTKKRVPAWVITWRYYDRSSNGVVRAYLSKQRADEDLALLKSDCSSDRVFEIQEMELYE